VDAEADFAAAVAASDDNDDNRMINYVVARNIGLIPHRITNEGARILVYMGLIPYRIMGGSDTSLHGVNSKPN
jgi:hypothetical protein